MGDCTSVCNKSVVLEVSEELGEHFYFFKCLLVLSILLSFHPFHRICQSVRFSLL